MCHPPFDIVGFNPAAYLATLPTRNSWCSSNSSEPCSILKSVYLKKKDCRAFNEGWTLKYIFSNPGNEAVYLLCHEAANVFKKYNLKWHHQKTCRNDPVRWQEKKAAVFFMKLKKKQPIFTKQSFLQDSATEACIMVGYNLAKNHKPFSDREFFQCSVYT